MNRRARPTARPAPHIGHWGYAIIRACPGIGYGPKVLIELYLELDRPEKDGVGGVYQDPGLLADQLGCTVNALKKLRAECEWLGVLTSVPVVGSNLMYWFPHLPAGFECPAAPPAGASQDERRVWVQTHAQRLARHLAAGALSAPQRSDAGALSAPDRCPEGTSMPISGALSARRDLSTSPPIRAQTGALKAPQTAPSVTLKQLHRECDTQECDTRSDPAEDECDTKGAAREVTIAQYRERLAHATDPNEKHLYEVALQRLEAAPAPTPSEEPAA